MTRAPLRAPFPYFGGKREAAAIVWGALGRVSNYVEPFFGSGAVLLSRPRETWATLDGPGTETVNDRSRFLANFWRALRADPDAVAEACDWPVNETDLHARHRWLVAQLPALAAAMDADPERFDAKIAGWWLWGACAWIGDAWCPETEVERLRQKIPHLSSAGQGVMSAAGGAACILTALSKRLRGVRVACGDWVRVCSDSATWRNGLTGVFLDPPYAEGNQQYAAGGTGTGLSAEVRAWAIEAGKRPDMRVILAGLDGEHDLPATWRTVPWKARGGYGSQGTTENLNRHREVLWLSPACLDATRQPSLFAAVGS